MAAIKSKDTKPEVFFRKLLFARGFRYRKNVSYIPGHPDLYLAKYRTAIFVHGCFWHRHKGCTYAYMPKSNQIFWNAKFNRNIKHDVEIKSELAQKKIKSLIIWECTIKKMKKNISIQNEVLKICESFLYSSNDDLWLEI